MESIEKGDDDAGLKSLIDLAESCPKFLRPQLDQLVGACIGKKNIFNFTEKWFIIIYLNFFNLNRCLQKHQSRRFLETFGSGSCGYSM